MPMKTLILSLMSGALLLSLTNCEHEHDHHRHDRDGRAREYGTTTTTTEETTVSRPSATVETRTTRSY